MPNKFYDCTKLLNSKDRNGNKPGLFIVVSQVRGTGKTFSIVSKLVENFLKTGGQFVLLTRNKKDIGGMAQGVLGGYLQVAHPGMIAKETCKMGQTYSVINLETYNADTEESESLQAGFCVALKGADDIKKISSLFVNVDYIFFDEFMPSDETSYLNNEIQKFWSIKTSISRGRGQSIRDVPVILAANTMNMQNPYFNALKMHKKIQKNTKFYKGDGFVYERCVNEALATKHAETGLAKAFGEQAEDYNTDEWVCDNNKCVVSAEGWGDSNYICTIYSGDITLGVRFYPSLGIFYFDTTYDENYPVKYITKIEDKQNYPLLKNNELFITLRSAIQNGAAWYRNAVCRNVAFDLLIY